MTPSQRAAVARARELVEGSRVVKGRADDGFELVALYPRFVNAGELVWFTVRFEREGTGEKDFRQAHVDAGRVRWTRPDTDGPDPLYRQHDVRERHDELVFYVEGEKCADALAGLGLVATTAGGANAHGNADLEPLHGRDVLIWPDADAPGRRHGERIAQRLGRHAASVRLVDIDALGLPKGGDCVDWLANHPHASASDVLALKTMPVRSTTNAPTAPKAVPAPSASEPTPRRIERRLHLESHCPQPADDDWAQEVELEGARLVSDAQAGLRAFVMSDGVEQKPIFVCGPLRVVAVGGNGEGAAWSRVLAFRDRAGADRVLVVHDRDRFSRDNPLAASLADAGLRIGSARATRKWLETFVYAEHDVREGLVAHGPGWREGAYVFGDRALTGQLDRNGRPIFIDQPECLRPYTIGGDLDGWRAGVAEPLAPHDLFVFALCSAFAGPLLGPLHAESTVFHLVGASSTGKSTVALLAASVWGAGRDDGVVRSWRATGNALETLAAGANDGLLVLDEFDELSAHEVGTTAYMLGNGAGKTRMTADARRRPTYRWRVVALSTGEATLAERMREAGRTVREGQRSRFIDVHVPDRASGMLDGGALAEPAVAFIDRRREAAARHHGAPARVFVARLAADLAVEQRAEQLMARRDAIARAWDCGSTCSWTARVTRRFAAVALAGELATGYGVTGWPEGRATEAVRAVWARWLERDGDPNLRFDREIAARLEALLTRYGRSRFEPLIRRGRGFVEPTDKGPTVRDRLGWRIESSTGHPTQWLINRDLLLQALDVRDNDVAVVESLRRIGALVARGDGSLSHRHRIANEQRRLLLVQRPPADSDVDRDACAAE